MNNKIKFNDADFPVVQNFTAKPSMKKEGIKKNLILQLENPVLFMIPSDSDDIVNSYNILLKELKKYNPEMLDKSRLIAITKSDLLDDELTDEIRLEIRDKIQEEFIFISSISNIGLVELKDKIWEMLN